MTAGRFDYRGAQVGERSTDIEAFRAEPIRSALRQRGTARSIPIGQHAWMPRSNITPHSNIIPYDLIRAGIHANYHDSASNDKTNFNSVVWLSMVTALLLLMTGCFNIIFSLQSMIEHVKIVADVTQNNSAEQLGNINSTYLILNVLVTLFSPFIIVISLAITMAGLAIICGTFTLEKCYVLINFMKLLAKVAPLMICFNGTLALYNLYVLPTLSCWNTASEGMSLNPVLGFLPGTQWASHNTTTLIVNLLILGANIFVGFKGSHYIRKIILSNHI